MNEIQKIEQDIAEQKEILENAEKKLKEKIQVDQFVRQAKDNPILKENHIITVNSNFFKFLAIMTILFFLFILGVTGLVIWLGFSGNLGGIIAPVFNNTVNIEPANVTIQPAKIDVNNQYNQTINNDLKITLYINNQTVNGSIQ